MYEGITILEHAGAHIAKNRKLKNEMMRLDAIQAAYHSNSDIQTFAILSVAIARVSYATDRQWVKLVCKILDIK